MAKNFNELKSHPIVETFGGGRESDEAMGAMRILRGMILARRRKGE